MKNQPPKRTDNPLGSSTWYGDDTIFHLALIYLGMVDEVRDYIAFPFCSTQGCMQQLAFDWKTQELDYVFKPAKDKPLAGKIVFIQGLNMIVDLREQGKNFSVIEQDLNRALEGLDGKKGDMPRLILLPMLIGPPGHFVMMVIEPAQDGSYGVSYFNPFGAMGRYADFERAFEQYCQTRYGTKMQYSTTKVQIDGHSCGPLVIEFARLIARKAMSGISICEHIEEIAQELKPKGNNALQMRKEHAQYWIGELNHTLIVNAEACFRTLIEDEVSEEKLEELKKYCHAVPCNPNRDKKLTLAESYKDIAAPVHNKGDKSTKAESLHQPSTQYVVLSVAKSLLLAFSSAGVLISMRHYSFAILPNVSIALGFGAISGVLGGLQYKLDSGIEWETGAYGRNIIIGSAIGFGAYAGSYTYLYYLPALEAYYSMSLAQYDIAIVISIAVVQAATLIAFELTRDKNL